MIGLIFRRVRKKVVKDETYDQTEDCYEIVIPVKDITAIIETTPVKDITAINIKARHCKDNQTTGTE